MENHSITPRHFLKIKLQCLKTAEFTDAVIANEACLRLLAGKLLCSDVRPCDFSPLVCDMPILKNPVPRDMPGVEILSGPLLPILRLYPVQQPVMQPLLQPELQPVQMYEYNLCISWSRPIFWPELLKTLHASIRDSKEKVHC